MSGAIVNKQPYIGAQPQPHEVKIEDAKEFISIVNSMRDFLRRKMDSKDGVNGCNGFLCMFSENPMSDSWKEFMNEFETFETEVNRSTTYNSPIFY